MASVEIAVHDGTIQCVPSIATRLEDVRARLEAAGITVANAANKHRAVIQLCGTPSGNYHVFSIDEADWRKNEIMLSSAGFALWGDGAAPRSSATAFAAPTGGGAIPWPWGGNTLGGDAPFPLGISKPAPGAPGLEALVGMKLRVIFDGDMITMEHLPNRFNIALARDSGKIVHTWFG